MTRQKNTPAAATAQGVHETYQRQFTPNSGKTQVPKIKYPMNPDMVITALEIGSEANLMIKYIMSRLRWREAVQQMRKRKAENRREIARTLGRM
jgi:hypothetical protein